MLNIASGMPAAGPHNYSDIGNNLRCLTELEYFHENPVSGHSNEKWRPLIRLHSDISQDSVLPSTNNLEKYA